MAAAPSSAGVRLLELHCPSEPPGPALPLEVLGDSALSLPGPLQEPAFVCRVGKASWEAQSPQSAMEQLMGLGTILALVLHS